MSTVFAGVAKPLKFLEEDFLVLKRANLQAEHKVIKNPVNGTNEDDIDDFFPIQLAADEKDKKEEYKVNV